MKVSIILLLACLSYFAAAQTNVAFTSTTSCTNGCSLSSIVTADIVTQLVASIAAGGTAALNLDFSSLQAGSSVTIDSTGLFALVKSINVNNFVAAGQTTVNVASGFTVNTANFAVQGSSTAVVAGIVQIQSQATSVTNFTVDASSTLYVTATGAVQAGATNVIAAGQANIAGSITTSGTYAQNSGNLFLNSTGTTQATATAAVYATGGINIAQSATLSGNGIIGGTTASAAVAVSVSGNIAIGNSPGTVTINGDWRPSATSIFKMEVASSSSYDQLFVTGKAYVNGGLQVTLLNNYGPAANTRFPFINAAGGTAGSFTGTVGTNANSITKWSSSVAANQVIANYNSAVTVAISGLVLVACVLASLL